MVSLAKSFLNYRSFVFKNFLIFVVVVSACPLLTLSKAVLGDHAMQLGYKAVHRGVNANEVYFPCSVFCSLIQFSFWLSGTAAVLMKSHCVIVLSKGKRRSVERYL